MRRQMAVPVTQNWFWTKEWQEIEHEANADIAAGRVSRYEDAEPSSTRCPTEYERTDSFVADCKRLKPEHKAAFKRVVSERFAPACDAWARAQDERRAYVWPKALRVEQMRGTSGITEMTWSTPHRMAAPPPSWYARLMNGTVSGHC